MGAASMQMTPIYHPRLPAGCANIYGQTALLPKCLSAKVSVHQTAFLPMVS